MEYKKCKHCWVKFEITDKDLEFYEKVSPVFDWKKYLIPSPTLCPGCRQQRRLSFRNERKLYKRKCDFSWKEIISIYSPDKPYKVYDQEKWWGDKWNPLDYGNNFDFSRSFFEQFWELLKDVPMLSIMNKQSENSDYCNYSFQNKNNYLTFWSHYEEWCMYGNYSTKNNFCLDCFWLYESELCYECMYSWKCYNCIYLDHCEDCENCHFSINLKWCKDCFLCSWLVWKQYCILNKQYSKEDYYDKLKHYNLWTYSDFDKLKDYFLNDLYKKFPLKESYKINSENCLGNNFQNCKNMFDIFNSSDSEDCRYWAQIDWTYDSMDMNFIGYDKSELCFEFIWCLWLYNCKFCNACWNNDSLIYCDFCFNSSNVFWCVWLKNKSYCILNKQYTKEEYNKIVPKIIEHMIESWEWWEFFPSSLSPFWYNETVAEEYFPLKKEDVLTKHLYENWKQIYNRSDYEVPIPKVDKIIPANKLPENISEIPDDILNWAIECEVTKKPFRIIKEELEFYRKHKLPIPRRHPDQRHLDRMKLRNPRKLYDRNCDKCNKEIKTTYSSDSKKIVYCDKCYEANIY